MNEYSFPDVGEVRARARLDWEKRERRRLGVQERIGQSVPWWLVIIAAVFYAISAPHTAAVFDQLTPGWGPVAPLGVEFGLLYAAFRRRQTARPPNSLRALEGLLFLTAIVVNAAGTFAAVVSATGLQHLTAVEMWNQFGNLPATSQVALFLVPLAALIIPIGTSVAGEGMAALLLERRNGGDVLELRWREVGQEVEFLALRDAAIASGVPPTRAANWAGRITGAQYTDYGDRPVISELPHVPQLPVGTESTERKAESGNGRVEVPRRAASVVARSYSKNMSARSDVRAYLDANPDAAGLPIMQLTDVLRQNGIQAGKSTVAEVRERFRNERK